MVTGDRTGKGHPIRHTHTDDPKAECGRRMESNALYEVATVELEEDVPGRWRWYWWFYSTEERIPMAVKCARDP